MGTFTLTTGTDTFVGSGADDTVNGTSATLNAADRLNGGAGHDTLALFGAGTFDLGSLAQFTGFEQVNLIKTTSGTSNLTLRNGVDLTVNVEDLQTNTDGVIQLADGDVTLNLGSAVGYTIYASTGTTTINGSGDYFGYLTSVYLSSGTATVNISGSIVVSTGLATIDFTGYHGYRYVTLRDVSTINYDNVYIGSSDTTFSNNNLIANGSGELDITRMHLDGTWYLNISSSDIITVNVDQASLSHLKAIYGGTTSKFQTTAAGLDLTHTPVNGDIAIVSTNAAGTTFTVADASTGTHVVGGVGHDTLVGQGFAFTPGQRAAIFALSSVETITDTSGTYNTHNHAPTVTASAGKTAATEQVAARVDSNLTPSDIDNATLASASVSISGHFHSGEDVLSFSSDGHTMGNVAASYDPGTGMLTLTSAGATATVAQWQAALRAVTYTNLSDTPNTADRTISFVVNDGTDNSATSTKTVSVGAVDDAPTVANHIADQVLGENQAWSFQVPANSFSDVDSGSLSYTATLADGSALPDWLTFGAQNRTFVGTAPHDFTGIVGLEVTAHDASSAASDTFALIVVPEDQPPIYGTTGSDVLNGTSAGDFINGLGGDDVLHGGAGDDVLVGGTGTDVMVGGAGNDSYFVDNPGDAVVENPGEGIDTVYSTAHLRLLDNVENLILQGGADLQGYANSLSNRLYGNSGSNILDGDAGADVMVGGAGNDAYYVDNAGDVVVENANEGNDTVFSTAHLRLTANVEYLVLQGNADLQGYGNSLSNGIYGNNGSNILDGGAGADLMVGGAGNDVYYVDNAGNMVVENASEGTDTVFSTAHLRLTANVEYLVLQGSADLQGYGNSLNNGLYGNSGSNILDGDAGADVMVGGAGNDFYFVDNAGDLVIENANEGTDTVFSTAHLRLTENVEYLVLQGSADLQGYGNSGNNGLYGNSGNNVLNGDAGADVLFGGAGNDAFIFNAGQAGGDTIIDFAGNGAAPGDWLLFIGYGPGATFTNIDPSHWQVNYNGGTSHDIITFSNAASIAASDFAFM
jgi:Ca2+-binding RTX toxin-like protein